MLLNTSINKLTNSLEYLKKYYLEHEKPENKKDPEFFQFVREQTEPIFEIIDQWYEAAISFVQNRNVYVHPQQIESTAENLKLILLHSYYIDVRRKRYMELYKSVLYVFDLLKNDLEEVQS
ncbi:DUF1798 family protein [Gracilibacillus sp. YIM 98692]|uniref:DUF1798 family protein n=1 Tax=Gracilibacillus sp. YIM 98692 TaxID=2663532 RepID=UPI0013D4701C|nr:DUF1798 family protein [Gracilibacillus sp. YIM 98692]